MRCGGQIVDEWIRVHLQQLCAQEVLVFVLKLYLGQLSGNIVVEFFFVGGGVVVGILAVSITLVKRDVVDRVDAVVLVDVQVNQFLDGRYYCCAVVVVANQLVQFGW